jgi:hypothetical protein
VPIVHKKEANINPNRNHAGREASGRSRGIQQGSAMPRSRAEAYASDAEERLVYHTCKSALFRAAAIVRLAGHHPAWLSWSAQILRASDSSVAVVARHAGVTGEPDVRSAKTRTIAASQF